MYKNITVLGFVAVFGLAACGDTDIERGVTGAAIGGVGTAALGGDAFTGALVGGAAGVLCDDLTPQYC